MSHDLNSRSVAFIKHEYQNTAEPWYLGFSGGKDSSALLKLTFQALKQVRHPHKNINIVYCDTGVEIPIVRDFAIRTLRAISSEAREYGLPFKIKIAVPLLADRYFVKVIGRGYPPPTNKFRWCTNRLRIGPVTRQLPAGSEKYTVLLGIRKNESAEREKTISRHATKREFYLNQCGRPNASILSPIINYSLDDVWETLLKRGAPTGINAQQLATLYKHAGGKRGAPTGINAQQLATLYKHAGGECPIIRDPTGSPCGKGRFGCWTCTVVRKDKAMTNMIQYEDYKNLSPLLQFRNWLIAIRDDSAYRCRWRRNGAQGSGPLTLAARAEILKNLIRVQTTSGLALIDDNEIFEIKRLWKIDRNSVRYKE
jgi:DNA sulfur modification protein DndC